MKRILVVLVALVLFAAACGDDGGDADAGDGGGDSSGDTGGDGGNGGDGGDSGEGGDGGEGGDAGSSDGDDMDDSDDGDDGDGIDNNATGDDDDFGDITGNDDLDLDDLPGDVGDMIDDIDDIVSLGDCVIETLGLGAVAPAGFQCRVLDNPLPGFDGFTMFSSETELEITMGTSFAAGNPCIVAGVCGNEVPIDIPGFSDAVQFDLAGITGGLFATHDEYDVELGAFSIALLTDADIALIQDAAASLQML